MIEVEGERLFNGKGEEVLAANYPIDERMFRTGRNCVEEVSKRDYSIE